MSSSGTCNFFIDSIEDIFFSSTNKHERYFMSFRNSSSELGHRSKWSCSSSVAFLQLCENHRRCLIDACFRTDLLYNDTPLLLCLAILYTKVVPILSSLLLVHQHHLHRSLVTSPDVLVLRVALYNIMIWPVILSRIMGISRGHDGFYDLVTHHINSPYLLMYMSMEALGRISLQDLWRPLVLAVELTQLS